MKVTELLEGENKSRNYLRLERLSSLLGKNAHRWGPNPSNRMTSWVDEYNDIKRKDPATWKAYCKDHDFDLSHDGYDVMA